MVIHALPAPADKPSAGAYLRLRREAADLTLRDTALLYARSPATAVAAELMLLSAERDATVLEDATLTRLLACFPFDPAIYQDLAANLPTSAICLACGCTWCDPCTDPRHGSCAWANIEGTLCTACERRQVAA